MHQSLEANILLNAKGEVVSRRYMRNNLECTDRNGEKRRGVGKVSKIVDVAIKDLESALLGRVVAQAAGAACASANASAMSSPISAPETR